MARWYLSAFSLIILFIISFIISDYYKFKNCPLLNIPAQGYILTVNKGYNINNIKQQLKRDKIIKNNYLWLFYARILGLTNKLQAGEYKISQGMTSVDILKKIAQGKVIQYPFTIIEGWCFQDLLLKIASEPKIKKTLLGLSYADIIKKLKTPYQHPEGIFFPDTYFFTVGTTDVAMLQRAIDVMQDKLINLWQHNNNNFLKNPYEALILASIIEKESSLPEEYSTIASVYQNRLSKKMRLQADPTVIYSLINAGALFSNSSKNKSLLKKKLKENLKINSSYNTYLHYGLPPTPIAIPSLNAIKAALNPSKTNYLYFVADGYGGHIFSENLEDHNKAIRSIITK